MKTLLSAMLVFVAAIAATSVSAGAVGERLDPMSGAAFRHLVAGADITEDRGPRRSASDIAEIDRRRG